MPLVKLTVERGKIRPKDVAVATGTALTVTDSMELRIDHTKLTKGDAIVLIDTLKARIFASKWPMI